MITVFACRRASQRMTDADLADVVEACAYQLTEHLGPDYGLFPPQVSLWSIDGTPLPPDTTRVTFRDVQPGDPPDALAFHSVDADGGLVEIPVDRILDSNGGRILDGSGSLCSVASHEFCEATVDEYCDQWSDSGDGTLYAREVCDPVQAYSYQVPLHDGRLATVSAYVKATYWNPHALDNSDFARGVKIEKHHEVAPGGYAVRRRGSKEVDVFGNIKAAWSLSGARLAQRGLGAPCPTCGG